MGKLWLNNELVDRLAMLQQTEATHPGINQVAIEKGWWVTVTLKALFQTDCREWLIFKGGTSLSKGFNIIERFSEDIDLAISHSFFGIEKSNKSQRDKLKKLARKHFHFCGRHYQTRRSRTGHSHSLRETWKYCHCHSLLWDWRPQSFTRLCIGTPNDRDECKGMDICH